MLNLQLTFQKLRGIKGMEQIESLDPSAHASPPLPPQPKALLQIEDNFDQPS